MRMRPSLLLALLIAPLSSTAFSFVLTSPPTVCSNLSMEWSGGTAPYEITLLPLGHVNPEIRTIVDTNTSDSSWSEQLLFPSGSTFVIVLSDATGFGSGGTSLVQTVGNGDSSCLPTSPSNSEFTFEMNPETPSQCGSLAFSWDGDGSTTGTVVISAIIPGGNSFVIPATSGGTSQSWTTDVTQNTDIAFMVGDSSGRGKGGSSDLMTVGGGSGSCLSGSYPSSTPGPAVGAVSTTGATSASEATGSSSGSASASASASGSTSMAPGSGGGTVTGAPPPVATGEGGSGQQGSSGGSTTSSHSNVGAIAGGVVGGVVALIILGLILFCCMRRRHRRPETEKGQTDLLGAPGDGDVSPTGPNDRSTWYEQEAFVPPGLRPVDMQSSRRTPSTANATEGPVSSGRRTATGTGTRSNPTSSPTDTSVPHGRGLPLPPGAAAPAQPAHPDTSLDREVAAAAAAHDPKKRAVEQRSQREMRPVNWVQHDDAGAVEEQPPAIEEAHDEPVTVDVPPSYEALQAMQRERSEDA